MGLKQNFFKQFSKPTGKLGKFIGWLMSVNNTDRSEWTLDKLDVQPDDIVLEIGYGPGSTFEAVAARLTTGFLAGIDHSEVMFEQTAKRCKKYLEDKKAELLCGTVWDLTYPDDYFDLIYGSNVHFFWKNPVKEFGKLYSLLKPNGRLVMVFQPRWAKTDDEVKQIAEETKKQFVEAGLKNVEIDFKPMKPITCIYIGGQK